MLLHPKMEEDSSISLSFMKEKEIHIECDGSTTGLFLLGIFPKLVFFQLLGTKYKNSIKTLE
jgi:hypothetical protein